MKRIYIKKTLLLIVFFAVSGWAFTQLINPGTLFSSEDLLKSAMVKTLDDCNPPSGLNLEYESSMPTGLLSWDGETPAEGWVLLMGPMMTVDINWYLSDPENYENPEAHIQRLTANSTYLYMNMFHQAPYEIYIVADCGDGQLQASDPLYFEVGERGEENIGEGCEAPFEVSAVADSPSSMIFSWEPQDGELYQIAWGPFGMEMHEGFFDNPEAGSVIVSENPFRLEFPRPGAEEPHALFIRKFCGGHEFSEWQEPACLPPVQLDSHMFEDYVQLTWTPTGSEIAWQVAYGPSGFDPDDEGNPEATRANVYEPFLELMFSELTQGIDFDFYVRTNCSGSSYSPWAGPGNFSTDFGPCDPVEELTASHITPYSADLQWTPVSGEYHWEVRYGPAPLDPDAAQTMTVDDPKAILTGLQMGETYEAVVTAQCVSGETAESEIISFTTIDYDETYCFPYFLNGCTYDMIDNLILPGENGTGFEDMNMGCTDSNYNDKTDQSVDLAPGNEYFVRVSHGNFPIHGDNLAVWIDFNDDGVFDNETERVGDGSLSASGFTDVNFEIPEGAETGEHRMRVMLAFNAYPYQLTPCNDGDSISTNGEVIDYTVNILDLENCTTAFAGTAEAGFETCPGETFTLHTDGASAPATGLIRSWQSSPAGQNNWTDVENGLLPEFTVYGGIEQATDFRYSVSCSLSGETSVSEVIEVGISTNCYCKPTSNCGGPGGLQINNVTLEGETITLNNQTGCSGDGYGDYTYKPIPDLEPGETYVLSVTADNAHLQDDKIKAWIDFNDNKVFESGEVIMNFPSGLPSYTVTNEFTVPEGTPPGLYRLRVRIGWYGSPPLEGCSVLGNGETEDYFIEILPGDTPEECLPPTDILIETDGDPDLVAVSWTPGGEENLWEVVYGTVGFDPEEATPVIVEEIPNLFITDLDPNTDYELYVRAVCDTDWESEWTGPAAFTTQGMSISDSDFMTLSYYPVPVKDILNIRSAHPIETLEIFNTGGQLLQKINPKNDEISLDIRMFDSGIYLVRVSMNGKTRTIKVIKN